MSNEYSVALLNGNVLKTRSVTRVVASGRLDKTALLAIKGIPSKLTMMDPGDAEVDIEALEQPHIHLDEAQRQAEDGEIAIDREEGPARLGGNKGMKTLDRNVRITKKDLLKYGYTRGARVA